MRHGTEVYFLGTKNAQLFVGHQYFYMYEVSYQINRTTSISQQKLKIQNATYEYLRALLGLAFSCSEQLTVWLQPTIHSGGEYKFLLLPCCPLPPFNYMFSSGYWWSPPQSIYTEQQRLLSGIHSIMRVKLAQAGEGLGGRCTPTPFHYICHHQQSCSVGTLQLSGQIH